MKRAPYYLLIVRKHNIKYLFLMPARMLPAATVLSNIFCIIIFVLAHGYHVHWCINVCLLRKQKIKFSQRLNAAIVTCFVWVGVFVVLVVKVRVHELLKRHQFPLCFLEEFKVHEQSDPGRPHLEQK